MEIARVTPSLPQRGRQPKKASPLDTLSGWILSLTAAELRSTVMLHGANPDEAVSALGPIAIRYRSPLFVF